MGFKYAPVEEGSSGVNVNHSFVETIKEAATPPRLLTLGIKWLVFLILLVGVVLFGFRKQIFCQFYLAEINN